MIAFAICEEACRKVGSPEKKKDWIPLVTNYRYLHTPELRKNGYTIENKVLMISRKIKQLKNKIKNLLELEYGQQFELCDNSDTISHPARK